jgi:exodeoxyribonuclease VII large subunit
VPTRPRPDRAPRRAPDQLALDTTTEWPPPEPVDEPFEGSDRAPEAAPGEPTFGVAELNQAISEALVDAFPRQVWVRGEIAQLRVSGNGHVYFDLCEKDERRDHVRAKLSVALWRNDRPGVNRTLKGADLKLDDGVEVRIRARVEFWPPGGRLQLIMDAIDPVFTVGKLAAQRARILQVLAADGLLRRQAELALPVVPLRVGLVTSRSSAAYHDFVQELDASGHAFCVYPVDVRVQGQGADRRVAFGINRLLAALGPGALDVIVVARGGGARSDLSAFDSERLARLIAELPIPVITGIGHEVDRTVADEVAHTSAKTPTAAAALLVGLVDDYRERLARLAHRLSIRARSACTLARRDTSHVARRIARAAPIAIARERQTLDAHRRAVVDCTQRGIRAADAQIERHDGRLRGVALAALRVEQARLETATARLRALDPRRVLERGYTITRTEDGVVLRDASAVTPGDVLVTETADGSVRSRALGSPDDEQAQEEEES